MIPAAARLAEVALPEVRHLVGDGLEDFNQGHYREVLRVQSDLVRGLARACAKAAGGEVPIGALFALQCEKALR